MLSDWQDVSLKERLPENEIKKERNSIQEWQDALNDWEKNSPKTLFDNKASFNNSAEPAPLEDLDFPDYLKRLFGKETAQEVLDAFKKMGIPAPHKKGQFLPGLEGGLVFLNKYGVVIRIERAHMHSGGVRIDDNAFIAKPVASLKIGRAVVEINLGVKQEDKPENVQYLRKALASQGIDYWDYKLSNTGRAPIHTPHFPDGVPIVIDRGAVAMLDFGTKPVGAALRQKYADEAAEAEKALEKIRAPLRSAFEKAWADPAKMKAFWKLAERFAAQGKLPAGWSDPQPRAAQKERTAFGDNEKTLQAAEVAKRYAVKLKRAEKKAAPAKPRAQL